MKRTLILILVLIIAVVGLLALSLNTKTTTSPTIPISMAHSTLLVTQPVASTSGTLSSAILIRTNTNTASAVQIELAYDPQSISIVDIKPGTFFKNPVELLKKIDSDNGRISYALGAPLGDKGVDGSGVVATLTFTKIKTSGIISINFLPKTEVAEVGVSSSVLSKATGVTFDLSK